MIRTVTLNPAVDKTVEIDDFRVDSVNRISGSRIDAGGKGINVSKTIASLGGTSEAVALLVGKSGELIADCLKRQQIETAIVWAEQGETRTNLKIIDRQNGRNTDINEAGPPVDAATLERVASRSLQGFCPGDVLVLSGSVPPGVPATVYRDWIALAKACGVQTVLDADGELLKNGLEAGPQLIKPNIAELERLAGCEFRSVEEVADFARSLCRIYDVKTVAVSLGADGALFVGLTEAYRAQGLVVEVNSTVGAGDAMVAALTLALEEKYDWQQTIRLAVAAGAASVMTGGTEPGSRGLVEELAKQVKFAALQ